MNPLVNSFEKAYEESKKVQAREKTYILVGLRWEFIGYTPMWVATYLIEGTTLKTVEMNIT